MTQEDSVCIHELERRVVRLEEKMDAAAELRELTHDTMMSLSSRMTWLLGLVISLFVLLGPGAGYMAYQLGELGHHFEEFETNVNDRIERLETVVDGLVKAHEGRT